MKNGQPYRGKSSLYKEILHYYLNNNLTLPLERKQFYMCILWKNVMVLLYVLKEDDGISENADNLLIFLNKGVELYMRCYQFF